MTPEQIKKRFIELQGAELARSAPWNYSLRVTRKNLLKELLEKGVKNSDAIYELNKIERELRDDAMFSKAEKPS
jgi:hypothetical protein